MVATSVAKEWETRLPDGLALKMTAVHVVLRPPQNTPKHSCQGRALS